MTAQRRELEAWCRGLALVVLLAVAPAAGRAATTERVVADRFTGLAIAGFDPVSYFTDARALPGDAAYELSKEGVIWRFRNEGNRASFAAHPEIYGPQFGGYDPVDVARGVAYPGNPRLWLVVDQRLYLFGREESRDAFASAPAAVLAEARKHWTVLRSELSQ